MHVTYYAVFLKILVYVRYILYYNLTLIYKKLKMCVQKKIFTTGNVRKIGASYFFFFLECFDLLAAASCTAICAAVSCFFFLIAFPPSFPPFVLPPWSPLLSVFFPFFFFFFFFLLPPPSVAPGMPKNSNALVAAAVLVVSPTLGWHQFPSIFRCWYLYSYRYCWIRTTSCRNPQYLQPLVLL